MKNMKKVVKFSSKSDGSENRGRSVSNKIGGIKRYPLQPPSWPWNVPRRIVAGSPTANLRVVSAEISCPPDYSSCQGNGMLPAGYIRKGKSLIEALRCSKISDEHHERIGSFLSGSYPIVHAKTVRLPDVIPAVQAPGICAHPT